MKKSSVFLIAGIFIFVFLVFAGSASVQIQSEQLKRNYILGEQLSGKIVIDLVNESAGSMIRINGVDSISLFNAVNASGLRENKDFTCEISGCRNSYLASERATGDITLNQESLLGFKAGGKEMQILEAQLTFSSDAPESCDNQIELYLPDMSTYLQNPVYKNESYCEQENPGCFDSSLAGQNMLELQPSPGYCNKILLSNAPAYLAGATIRNTTTLVRQITMQIYRLDDISKPLGECILPTLKNQEERVSCVIEKPIISGYYFVCTSAPAGNYKIKTESEGNVCGTSNLASEDFSADYDIFARPLKYNFPVINAASETKKQTIETKDLEDYINDYLEKTYADNDCSKNCIFPFKIENNIASNQVIKILNASLKYSSTVGVGTSNDLYLLNARSSSISGNALEIDMAKANFTLQSLGQRNITINIGDKRINLSVNVIQGFETGFAPNFAYIQIPTSFSIQTNENISQVTWNFGDGTAPVTGSKVKSHTYSLPGEYIVNVKIQNTRGVMVEKNYPVNVGDIDGTIRYLRNATDLHLSKIKTNLDSFPLFFREKVKNAVNLTFSEGEYARLLNTLNTSLNDSDKIDLIGKINALDIPDSIEFGSVETLPMAIGFSGIDSKYISKISNAEISQEKKAELSDAVIYWIGQNYNPEVDRKEVVSKKGNTKEVIGSFYSARFNKKSNFSGEVFFILEYPKEEILFSENENLSTLAEEGYSASYLDISQKQKIDFYIGGETKTESLGMYISPKVDILGDFGEKAPFYKKLPTGWLIFWIIILIIVFLSVYIFLQEWYKNKYEFHLFKNRDDLYNLFAFIFNARQAGMSDSEAVKKLEASGWKGEQISYAMKKFNGKRTGMWEIPIFRGRERKKMFEEIEKRRKIGTDARFIKRPFM